MSLPSVVQVELKCKAIAADGCALLSRPITFSKECEIFIFFLCVFRLDEVDDNTHKDEVVLLSIRLLGSCSVWECVVCFKGWCVFHVKEVPSLESKDLFLVFVSGDVSKSSAGAYAIVFFFFFFWSFIIMAMYFFFFPFFFKDRTFTFFWGGLTVGLWSVFFFYIP